MEFSELKSIKCSLRMFFDGGGGFFGFWQEKKDKNKQVWVNVV